MARLRKQVLGQVQGTIASIVIKYRNGKPYVATRPAKFNTGKDPVTLFKKNQGRFIGKLAKAIYGIEVLKKIWFLSDEIKGYTYQQIWARNYHSIKNTDLSGTVTLLPSCGFKTSGQTIVLKENEKGKLTASPLDNKIGINPAIEKKIIAAGVVILKNNIHGSESDFGFMSVMSKPVDLSLTDPIDINFIALPVTASVLSYFSIRKAYITLITLDESGSPIHYSEVFSGG
jgi:hypothetical protein